MTSLRHLLFGDRRDPREVLHQVFGTTTGSGSPQPEALTWARRTLQAAQVDGVRDPVAAINVLRHAEPRLSLSATRYLVVHI